MGICPEVCSRALGETLEAVGLFAGIGGIELGLSRAGIDSTMLCEIETSARSVLGHRFPNAILESDVCGLATLPRCDVLTAGFPCTDLSQAGTKRGLSGDNSSLVHEVFRLLDASRSPEWVVIENVPFMLKLDGGSAIAAITAELAQRGFAWAYRTVDARAFGLPQRRRRVLIVASKRHKPDDVIFADQDVAPEFHPAEKAACGFYWTEGNTGIGWAVDAIPTLKGGSHLGIPSPPAVWTLDGSLVTPAITDAERLQGFPADWTSVVGRRDRKRWRLVGNAVPAPMAKWIGRRLVSPGTADVSKKPLDPGRWPAAACGSGNDVYSVDVGEFPVRHIYRHLDKFLLKPLPLSERAASGFYKRLAQSSLRVDENFLADLRAWTNEPAA